MIGEIRRNIQLKIFQRSIHTHNVLDEVELKLNFYLQTEHLFTSDLIMSGLEKVGHSHMRTQPDNTPMFPIRLVLEHKYPAR